MNLKYNETTRFQNLWNRGKKKKNQFCIPLPDRHIENDLTQNIFSLKPMDFFFYQNLYVAVRGVVCTILLFLMYFYCKILNCYYFEAF